MHASNGSDRITTFKLLYRNPALIWFIDEKWFIVFSSEECTIGLI